jgi:uncharacterized phage-associated protein
MWIVFDKYNSIVVYLKGIKRITSVSGITFQFNKTKAIEVILFLANKISNPDIYGICKLLYFSDKTSLERYGRFIFGETYCAMKEGATPSYAYNLLKEASIAPVNGLKVEKNQVIPLRKPDLGHLSQSDIECLNDIVKIYGEYPNWVKRKDAHDDAWKKSWSKRGTRKSVLIPVEYIAELLAESDDLIDYLSHVG